jgi:hypothetical protein
MAAMRIEHVTTAESGWKAVFKEPDGKESLSRILAWAAAGSGDEMELVGLIVDPGEPSKIVAARDASSPAGGSFARYRYVAPEPTVIAAPPAAPAKTEDTAEKLAKGLLKRGR